MNEAEEEKKGDHKYYNQERQAEKVFDQYVNQVARKYKVETIPWLTITKFVVWIFLGLTMVTMLKKNAFLSITVAALALYILDNP